MASRDLGTQTTAATFLPTSLITCPVGGADPTDVYQDALEKVMHTTTTSGLRISDLRGSDGELGLKAAGSDKYFGVINIGDTAAFKGLVEAADTGIVVADDALNGSLFDGISEPNSTVEVLVGSRKFIEGWNSWRVSSMGLLNIGRSEGSQIIQLFGRGGPTERPRNVAEA